MKFSIKTVSLAAVLTALLAPFAAAEDAVPQERFLMWWDYVNPAMTTEYEAAMKDTIKAYTRAEIADLSWGAVQTAEGYGYMIPVGEKYAGLDMFIESWGAAREKVGDERMDAINDQSSKAVYRHRAEFLKLRPDLSYAPAGDFKARDAGYRNIQMYYAIPGQEDEMEAAAKEWVELYSKNDVKHGFYVYQVTVGPDMPLYLVVQRATSAAAFHEMNEATYKTMQAESDALTAKTMSITRKRQVYDASTRPDLAYPPVDDKRMARN